MRRPFRAAESKIAVCANLHGTNSAFIAVFAGFRGKQHIGIEIPAVPQAAHRIRRQIVLRNEQRSGDCLRRRLRIFVVIVVQQQAERRCRRKYQQSRQQTAKEPADRCFLHHIRPKTAASTAAPAAANGSSLFRFGRCFCLIGRQRHTVRQVDLLSVQPQFRLCSALCRSSERNRKRSIRIGLSPAPAAYRPEAKVGIYRFYSASTARPA